MERKLKLQHTWCRLDLCLNQRSSMVFPPSSVVNPTCIGLKDKFPKVLLKEMLKWYVRNWTRL